MRAARGRAGVECAMDRDSVAAGEEPRAAPALHMRLLFLAVDAVQYAVVLALLILAAVVLVRTVYSFLSAPGSYPSSLIEALDGVLVVIIILDILRTVLSHFELSGFPVRPFLVIGILAAVRDILSASAHLTLATILTSRNFDQNLLELGVGVGVVVILLGGLALLRWSGNPDEPGPAETARGGRTGVSGWGDG
jgi:uncharacterized membrane protein (DUF373 family)